MKSTGDRREEPPDTLAAETPSSAPATLPATDAGAAADLVQLDMPLTQAEGDCLLAKLEASGEVANGVVDGDVDAMQQALAIAADCRTTVTYTATLATDLAAGEGPAAVECTKAALAEAGPETIDQLIATGWAPDQAPPPDVEKLLDVLSSDCGLELTY